MCLECAKRQYFWRKFFVDSYKKDRRLNIRIDSETWKRLDEKREKAGYTWTHLGQRLFKKWLHEDRTAEEDQMAELLIRFLRTNDSDGMRNVLDSILQPQQKKVRNLKSG